MRNKNIGIQAVKEWGKHFANTREKRAIPRHNGTYLSPSSRDGQTSTEQPKRSNAIGRDILKQNDLQAVCCHYNSGLEMYIGLFVSLAGNMLISA
jgi:hypothetical protein